MKRKWKLVMLIAGASLFMMVFRDFDLYREIRRTWWQPVFQAMGSQEVRADFYAFEPNWIRGYACDYNRCPGKKMLRNRTKDLKDVDAYWLVSLRDVAVHPMFTAKNIVNIGRIQIRYMERN